jgi:cysteine synthase
MIFKSVIEMIGNTPIVEYKTKEPGGSRILVKLEGSNPTGSIKDRGCIYNIMGAIKSGELTKDKIILDASSGNMACSLSYFGRLLGYEVSVVCNSKLTQDKKQFIEYFGAKLDIHGDMTIEGNLLCKQLAKENGKFCFLDQLHNPNNPLASYETLGPEIHEEVKNVVAVVGSMGSGGSMCGTARYFRENKPDTKIFTTQAASGTKIPGTGAFVDGDYISPFIEELQGIPLYNDTFFINETQARQRTAELATQGIFVGFQGGGVLQGTLEAIRKYGLDGNVVMIIGDSGWKNLNKLISLRK